MRRTAVLNVVGLTADLIGEHTPFLKRWSDERQVAAITPVLPAVTCSVQATYLTGAPPSAHGIVGNGWYFRDTGEVRFWMRSDGLIQQPRIWDVARARDPSFTCANLFWRYATHSAADYVVVERPQYFADGRKEPDVYSEPGSLRDELQRELGRFPLFEFWGPRTSIRSSQWIAGAAKIVEEKHAPTLSLVYLPHLDYNLQRLGPGDPAIATDLQEIDGVCADLIRFYERRGARVIVLSEYGITPVRRPVHLNRVLRREGYLTVREERGRELLEAGTCRAFAVADHQIAHVYVKDPADAAAVRERIEAVPGVERVLGEEGKAACGLDHPRAGDLVAVAAPEAWFTYYYWLGDERAPDFARTVAIHRKPGYDPVEMFVDPDLRFPTLKAGWILAKKKLGFRYVMDLISLDGSLVRGSHGRLPAHTGEAPVFITDCPEPLPTGALHATDVRNVILSSVMSVREW